MDISSLFDNKLSIAVLSAASGVVLAALAQHFQNKRSVFSFNVWHSRVGLSADDPVYGSVRVLWNDSAINHLYLSTVEVRNQSLKDYDSVVVRVFSNDTLLLTQRTSIADTTRIIPFTEEYAQTIAVAEGHQPTDEQVELFRRQRDYYVPTMNRGQLLRFEFLNAATSNEQPSIWVDILHKGIVCKFKRPVNMIYGVPQPNAVFVGTVLCLLGVGTIIFYVKSLVLASLLAFFLGWITLIPGALCIKAWKWLKDCFAG